MRRCTRPAVLWSTWFGRNLLCRLHLWDPRRTAKVLPRGRHVPQDRIVRNRDARQDETALWVVTFDTTEMRSRCRSQRGPEIFKIEQRDLFQDLGIDPLGLLLTPAVPPTKEQLALRRSALAALLSGGKPKPPLGQCRGLTNSMSMLVRDSGHALATNHKCTVIDECRCNRFQCSASSQSTKMSSTAVEPRLALGKPRAASPRQSPRLHCEKR